VALSNYSELQTAIAKWLVRNDLTARIPDFITLAEARISRILRVRQMISQDTGTISAQAYTLPTDFVEVLRLRLDTETDKPLEYRPIEDSELRVAGVESGEPNWFSVVGGELRFYPSPDGDYDLTLDYYAKVPALSDTNTTNWLLTAAPDLYLSMSMAAAYSATLEDEREQVWMGKANAVITSMHAAEARAKRTSGPRRSRILV
jgi:hypothetical protein